MQRTTVISVGTFGNSSGLPNDIQSPAGIGSRLDWLLNRLSFDSVWEVRCTEASYSVLAQQIPAPNRASPMNPWAQNTSWGKLQTGLLVKAYMQNPDRLVSVGFLSALAQVPSAELGFGHGLRLREAKPWGHSRWGWCYCQRWLRCLGLAEVRTFGVVLAQMCLLSQWDIGRRAYLWDLDFDSSGITILSMLE